MSGRVPHVKYMKKYVTFNCTNQPLKRIKQQFVLAVLSIFRTDPQDESHT